jgi:hypothetical protein
MYIIRYHKNGAYYSIRRVFGPVVHYSGYSRAEALEDYKSKY